MSADSGLFRQAIRQAGGLRAKGTRVAASSRGRSDAFPYEFADRVAPANCRVSHSTTSPSATPTRSANVLASRMNTMIAAIAPARPAAASPAARRLR